MNHEIVKRVARALYEAINDSPMDVYLGSFDDGCHIVVDGTVNFLHLAELAIAAHNEAVIGRLPYSPFPGLPHGTKEANDDTN